VQPLRVVKPHRPQSGVAKQISSGSSPDIVNTQYYQMLALILPMETGAI
jgi:hypothetical protein